MCSIIFFGIIFALAITGTYLYNEDMAQITGKSSLFTKLKDFIKGIEWEE